MLHLLLYLSVTICAGERLTWEAAAGGTKGLIVASLRFSGALFLPTAEQSSRIPERYDEIPER